MHQRISFFATVPLVALIALGAAAVQVDAGTGRHVRSAQDRVNDAVSIVQQMKDNPRLTRLLERAEGIFIVPHYGKAGFIVGGQGGGGVVLAKRHGTWSDPAFYSIGGGSIGAQAGGAGGAIAMFLMTHKAVRKFEDSSGTWSLDANAGLTVVKFSGRSQADSNRGDVVLWSNTKGLYGGLTAGVTDITPDSKMDHAYYRRDADPRQILLGSVMNRHAESLRDALAMRVAQR